MSKFGLDAPIGPQSDVGAEQDPTGQPRTTPIYKMRKLGIERPIPAGRAPFRSWRMNSAMPPPRTVKETSRIRACCWIARY